jgi:hypothetical protein
LDRALVSGTRGRAFESRIAHHNGNTGSGCLQAPLFLHRELHSPHYRLQKDDALVPLHE